MVVKVIFGQVECETVYPGEFNRGSQSAADLPETKQV